MNFERVFHFHFFVFLEQMNYRRDNGNDHRAAAKIIVSKSRAARGSVFIVLLCRDLKVQGVVSHIM